MIKMIAAACRRPGMTHAEYLTYIHRVHASIARENPVTLRRYVQNHVFDAAFGTAGEARHRLIVSRDSVTELYWVSFEAMAQTFAHPHIREKVGPDGRNFADESLSLSLVAIDAECAVPAAGVGGAKVMHFLRMAPGLELGAFFERWSGAHRRIVEEDPAAVAAIRRCVHSRQVPQANDMLKYFNAKDMPIYEGVASLWFDDAASVGLYRRYEQALLRINQEPGQGFYAPDESFFVYANEIDVLGSD